MAIDFEKAKTIKIFNDIQEEIKSIIIKDPDTLVFGMKMASQLKRNKSYPTDLTYGLAYLMGIVAERQKITPKTGGTVKGE